MPGFSGNGKTDVETEEEIDAMDGLELSGLSGVIEEEEDVEGRERGRVVEYVVSR